jgi:hypothetical protein
MMLKQHQISHRLKIWPVARSPGTARTKQQPPGVCQRQT